MVKILFVCHGNICRSPMAEFVMKDMVRCRGLEGKYEIASAAVSTEEIGNPVYPPARRELLRHGIDPAGKVARQITRQDYRHYDRIYYMDGSNLRWLRRLMPEDPQGKIRPLLDRDVADPWYTGDFTATWEDVTQGCAAILEEMEHE